MNGGLSLGSGRASSFDQYNSDSEVFGGGYPMPRSSAALRTMSASVPTGADDRSYYSGYSSADETDSWPAKFDSMTLSSVNNPHLVRAKLAGQSYSLLVLRDFYVLFCIYVCSKASAISLCKRPARLSG